MIRWIQAAGVLLLAASAAVCAQVEKGGKKNGAPGGSGLFRPVIPKGGGPKGVPKAPPPRISNPYSPAAHLFRASPEERDRALEKLRLPLQERLRNELDQFDRLPKEQQEMVIRQTELFDALSDEKKAAFREQFVALNRLERERKQVVAAALRRLHNFAPEERQKVLARPAFRERFSTAEFQIITTLAEVMLPPI